MSDAQTPSLQALLDGILGGETDLSQIAQRGKDLYAQGEDKLAEALGVGADEKSRKHLRLGSAAAAGALAMILGNRSRRKVAGLAGLGALGVIAYKAHQAGVVPRSLDDIAELLNGKSGEKRATAMLAAMIAAAKADGVISDSEQAMLDQLDDVDSDAARAVLEAPADPIAIAALATDDQMGRELYAASARIAEGLNPGERDYLDRLAMALQLDPETAARLETDVRTG